MSLASALIIALLSCAACVLLLVMQAVALVRLHREAAARDARVGQLREEVYALLQCGRGFGNRLKTQQRRLSNLLHRQEQLEQQGMSGGDPYLVAATMARQGASAPELVENCGLTRGEAELAARLKDLPATRPRLSRSA